MSGAFETPYQSAPLDITEESFYHAREELIERRLTEIINGQAQQILETADDKYRGNKTWGVGVQWDSFEKQHLLEITHVSSSKVGLGEFQRLIGTCAQCLGGSVLSVICRCFCERYSGGGVPDLIVWNIETGHCMFVEVKGPGDTLQQNQRVKSIHLNASGHRADLKFYGQVWIDVLLRGQASVELCHVIEQGKKSASKIARGTAKKRKGKGRGSLESECESEHEIMTVESEDEESSMQDDSPIFEMKTPDVSLDVIPSETDDDEEELEFIPGNSSRGTKRKSDQHLESGVSRSSSSKSIVEVFIPTSSGKKRHKCSNGST